MNVTVLLFAAAREAAGTDRLEVEAGENATVGDVLRLATERAPALAPVLPSCRAALDEEFARTDTVVPAGGVVAVLPPVSGG